MTGLWVAAAAILIALAFGGYRAVADGRFRGTHRVRGAEEHVDTAAQETTWDQLGAAVTGRALGEQATLVQFSSAFCAPCRVTRRVLEDVAGATAGVQHVEIDAEHHLDVVRRLGILRTPTTLVLDQTGREITRAAGAPRKEQVVQALALIR